MTLIVELHGSLTQRHRPEDVALTIVSSNEFETLGFTTSEKNSLKRVSSSGYNWSSMSKVFQGASGLVSQIKVASELFPKVRVPSDTTDVEEVFSYIEKLKSSLKIDGIDFKVDRSNREKREGLRAVPKSHRAYNKRFRLISRMNEKFGRWVENKNIRDLAQISKSRLASHIKLKDLKDTATACFIAYFAARSNMRSIFTAGKQERAFDTVSQMLFNKLTKKSNWLAIAYVHPSPEVLTHLSEKDKGKLLATWYSVMERAAKVISSEVTLNEIDLKQMIVRRGNDSSTWNESAGAFNKARDGWINTLHALGADHVLDRFAPGKILRLMAADVAYLHRSYTGDGLEPDTKVWNNLPKPWEVILGKADCNRSMIEETCRKAGIEGKGWIVPREKSVAEWKPTPELVYGVQIGSPTLALILKRAGFFAGPSKHKTSKTSVKSLEAL